ncbi:hypothetical protein AB6919_000346 [Vibrio cholerae]|nr:hypothetical protein [Vibrio cholerae]EJL6485836.1 hypothetical protein [Vibrio cholerae]EJL6888365.1 hypothetical protein [Vibrio cholerae]EKF9424077.1 hypothetical protein [Vibrio cholerae]
MIVTHTDNDKRLHVVFDDERTAPPENYTIQLVSMSRGVAAQPWESPAATWQRVLDTVAGMRASLDAPLLYFATVFADVSPTEQQRQAITKDRVSERLYQLADPRRNKNADTRVKALAALAELYGLHQPVSFTLPTLEQIEAEIAS